MGERPTRRAGLVKTRFQDPQLQKMFDGIIERLEILDGVRGDSLDRAVTYRDLKDSGFTIISGAGGSSQIVNTPGPGDGTDAPGVGPAGPPSNLVVTETFLAVLLTWDNTNINVQHIEIWRGTFADGEDGLSLAVKIATTIAPLYVDYVGSNASYYYWVRTVATDGTFSAYNDTTGTLGTTGINPSDLLVEGSAFIIADGAEEINPFLTGTINGVPAVGFQGEFVLDGTFRAVSIHASGIGAEYIVAANLAALAIQTGTLRVNRLTTGSDGTAPDYTDQTSFRLELEDVNGSLYPLWYGSGAKGEAGRFFVRNDGTVVVKGLLKAGMIAQSFFAPAGNDNAFRIATQYNETPGNPFYVGGEYIGKKAHLFPEFSVNETPNFSLIRDTAPFFHYPSRVIQFVGPESPTNIEYGRLGTNSEMISIKITVNAKRDPLASGDSSIRVTLQYQYDDTVDLFGNPTYLGAFYFDLATNLTPSATYSQIFVTRETAFDWINLRLYVQAWPNGTFDTNATSILDRLSFTCSTPNFGTADASITGVASGVEIGTLIGFPQWS